MEKQDKLNMHTSNLADNNFAALAAMFPNAVTETVDENGEVIRTIDADVLAQEINTRVVSGKEERYQFTWPDKKKSVLLANAPIAATLRPSREESVDFDETDNLYIEGDNLDVLKLLRETYLNRVKMIYIDPPYNTGNDFIYEDNFVEGTGEFLRRDGQYDEQGNRLTSNLESNGRFHTDWLNLMYPRLRIARDLLIDDGIIFISIANQEIDNMKKISDEIFGMTNFVGIIDWESKTKCQNTKTAKRQLQNKQEYILVYKKQSRRYEFNLETTEERSYPNEDEKGNFRYEQIGEMSANGIRGRSTMTFPILDILPKEGNQWKYGKETINQFLERGDLIKMEGKVYFKIREDDEEDKMEPFWSFISKEIGTAETAKKELKHIIGEHGFETVKPVNLIKKLIFHVCAKNETNNDNIVLDFFSGSSTTAHAVMQLNADDGGNRKFIMVQLPEVTDENSEARNAGYKNICEIGKERIRRAGAKIKEEAGLIAQNLDVGFRVLKLDSSNMKEVYYTPEEYSQMGFNLEGFMDNIKPDRTDEDLLFQVMLDLGIPLSARIDQDGKIFKVNENYLIACFDRVDTSMITEIAQKQPYYAVFRDSSFINDSALVNVEQIFNTYSPSTIRRVL